MKRISSSTAPKVELTTQDTRILRCYLVSLYLIWMNYTYEILTTLVRDVIYFLNEDNQMRY
jgi:hypothetical protein